MQIEEKLNVRHKAGKTTASHTIKVGAGRTVFTVELGDERYRFDREGAAHFRATLEGQTWDAESEPRRLGIISAITLALGK